jgi:hypothetical protein
MPAATAPINHPLLNPPAVGAANALEVVVCTEGKVVEELEATSAELIGAV